MGWVITMKKMVTIPFDRNTNVVKEKRKLHADWFLEYGVLFEDKVYTDETGFNLWTKRSSGRSRKGTPAAIVTSGQKGQNMTLVIAISSAGVIHHEFVDGSLRGETFQQFLISTSAKVDGPCLFTYDNDRLIIMPAFTQ